MVAGICRLEKLSPVDFSGTEVPPLDLIAGDE